MSKKPFDAQQELVQKEANVRAEKINKSAEKILDIAVADQLTVNDLQVIVQQLTQQMNMVFLSRQCSEFVDPVAAPAPDLGETSAAPVEAKE